MQRVVIPVAGMGTRMLPFTKEQPKEMLPLYVNGNGSTIMPIVQLIFDQLFESGFRDFCFIVGRGKRVIEDHFTINHTLHKLVDKKNPGIMSLEKFYNQLENSKIVWINQGAPKGFGHAVLQADSYVGNNDFIVHAGDVSIISTGTSKLLNRVRSFHRDNRLDVTLVVKEINDPASLKQHGVVIPGLSLREGFSVEGVVEKPAAPPSNLGIMPIYVFKSRIFEALKQTNVDPKGERQLTDSIQRGIDTGGKGGALKIRPDEIHLDIGTPSSYMQALSLSYKFSTSEIIYSKLG